MKNLIVLDIDGTLIDTTESIKYLDGTIETNNYSTYFKTLDTGIPYDDGIKLAQLLQIKYEADLLFLTSRNCNKFASFYSCEFVEKYFGSYNCFKNILFRALGDERPSSEMKLSKLNMLKDSYNICAIMEDEPKIIKTYSETAFLVKTDLFVVNLFNWQWDYEDLKLLPVRDKIFRVSR